MVFKKEIVALIAKHTQIDEKAIEELLEIPPDLKFGDYAFPCFFLAKEKKEAPTKIAKELTEKIKPAGVIEKIEAHGPYLNFFINKAEFAKHVLTEMLEIEKQKETIMVEFSGPNTNKPQHLGHVRNNVIGDSISRILAFVGNKVVRANLYQDRGIHICKSMFAYQKWGQNSEPDIKPDHFVGKYYVMFSEKAKENPELENEAQELLKKWEAGDKEALQSWQKMREWCLKGFAQTYENLGINFDKNYYESEYYKKGKEIVLDAEKKGIFSKDEKGAIIAPLEPDFPNKVVLRADGTSIYVTQDIYLAQLKFKDYKLDKSIYVVGSEQNLYFKQLFAVLNLLGYDWAKKCHHLSYGMVNLPSGKLKSREGTKVDADDLIEQVIGLAAKEVKKRHENLNELDIKERARIIGLAALKFMLLKYDPGRTILYNPEESISFEGETGPYLQYTYARICSIFKKGKVEFKKEGIDFSLLNEKIEHNLVNQLFIFPEMVVQASEQLKPSLISRYLLDLTQMLNEFYHKCPVLTEKDDLKNVRLVLIDKVRNTIKEGLALLGIEVLEEM